MPPELMAYEGRAVVIDPDVRWKVDPAELNSKSANSPFLGWELQGRAERVSPPE